MEKTSKKSRYSDRRITCFPPKKYNTLLKAYADWNEISISEAGTLAMKHFINNLPADQKLLIEAEMNKQESKTS